MDRLKKVKLLDLIEDFELYPRANIDAATIQALRHAIRAGVTLPPMVVCAKTLVIADGFNRERAHKAEFGEQYEIEVLTREYASRRDLFLDAIHLNSTHGAKLDPFDRAHAALNAKAMHIAAGAIAKALSITEDALTVLLRDRGARKRIAGVRSGNSEEVIVLKRTVRHMAGKLLTEKQALLNEHLSGQQPVAQVNELLALFDAQLIDYQNAKLVERLLLLGRVIASDEKLMKQGRALAERKAS